MVLVLKRRFSDKRTRALPDDRRDGIDASHRNLLFGGVPVEMFEI